MEASTILYESVFCRLCGIKNTDGVQLFLPGQNGGNLSQLVNKYLPLQVKDDGKYPCTICPGCNFQLEVTKSFFELIVEGQIKLRKLLAREQDALRRERRQLVKALKNVDPDCTLQTYSIQSDDTGEKFLIQNGPLFTPDHELALRVEGINKPRRKRGRPPKLPQSENQPEYAVEESVPDHDTEDDNIENDDRRRRRKIKVPSRYQEVLQGKEMDRIFKEEGVIHDDSMSEDDEVKDDADCHKDGDEVIGHMQSKDGENLGELIVPSKSINKLKIKNKRVMGISKKRRRYECKTCKRVFLHASRLETHKSFHKIVKYRCGLESCMVVTETKLKMDEHHIASGHQGVILEEHLNDEQQNTSNHSKMEAEDVLPEQFVNSNEQARVDCNSVNNETENVKTNSLHVENKDINVVVEEQNTKELPDIKTPPAHAQKHNEKTYPCNRCNKEFNHPSSLVYHREAEHNNGKRFVCSKCSKTFKHKQLLLRHQLVHSNERPFLCKFCDACFKTKANLLNHMPIHTGEKKYFCTICGQQFAHKTSLTLHNRWHNGQKPYQCDICLKCFTQKGNLQEHKRIHTGEKPYKCTYCGQRFTTSSQYKLHEKRHTGERPWRCEYCSKTFLHKGAWLCHMRRHRNERPYQCQQCFRGFTEQWALKKHERLHTGVKPYACDICNKTFADTSNLNKHKKVHQNNKTNQKKDKPKIQVVTQNEEGGKYVYVTYQDGCLYEGQAQTVVHIMDTINPDEGSPSNGPENVDQSIISDNITVNLEESSNMSLEAPLQLQQVVDADGNPVTLPTSDGQHIKVVMGINDDQQSVQRLLADGTLVPVDLIIQDTKSEQAEILTVHPSKGSESKDSAVDGNKQDDVVEQLIDSGVHFLPEGGKIDGNLQFLTEDGQNLCFVTAYNIDDTINPQYLSIT